MTVASAQTFEKMKLELRCVYYIVIFVIQIETGSPSPQKVTYRRGTFYCVFRITKDMH